jgi:hypothetical protein
VREILHRAAGPVGAGADPEAIDRLADACAGRPFPAEVAGRVAARGRAAAAAASSWVPVLVGDRDASERRVRRLAGIAADAPPLMTTGAIRACAYAASASGDKAAAIADLDRAEREAPRHGHRVDAAIARYQRGRRLGGAEGEGLIVEARRAIVDLGSIERLLDEDAGLR